MGYRIGFLSPEARRGPRERGPATHSGRSPRFQPQITPRRTRWSAAHERPRRSPFAPPLTPSPGRQIRLSSTRAWKGEVEGVQGLPPRQAGELEAGAHAALLARLLLPLADPVQEPGQTQLFLDGPLQQLRQALGDPLQAQLWSAGCGWRPTLGGNPGGHQRGLPARSTSAA